MCPICGSTSSFEFASKYVDIAQCQNMECMHLFATNAEEEHGVMLAVDFEESFKLYHQRNERLIGFLVARGILEESSKILDFGAGTGHILRTLRERFPGLDISCYEPNQECCSFLSQQGFKVHQTLDAIKEKYNLILLIEAIEHVPDPISTFQKLRSVMEEDGCVFLTTPCGQRRDGSRATNAYDTPEHVHFFTELSLNAALTRAGFEPMQFEHIEELYPEAAQKRHRRRIGTTFRKIKRAYKTRQKIKAQGFSHLTGFVYCRPQNTD